MLKWKEEKFDQPKINTKRKMCVRVFCWRKSRALKLVNGKHETLVKGKHEKLLKFRIEREKIRERK